MTWKLVLITAMGIAMAALAQFVVYALWQLRRDDDDEIRAAHKSGPVGQCNPRIRARRGEPDAQPVRERPAIGRRNPVARETEPGKYKSQNRRQRNRSQNQNP